MRSILPASVRTISTRPSWRMMTRYPSRLPSLPRSQMPAQSCDPSVLLSKKLNEILTSGQSSAILFDCLRRSFTGSSAGDGELGVMGGKSSAAITRCCRACPRITLSFPDGARWIDKGRSIQQRQVYSEKAACANVPASGKRSESEMTVRSDPASHTKLAATVSVASHARPSWRHRFTLGAEGILKPGLPGAAPKPGDFIARRSSAHPKPRTSNQSAKRNAKSPGCKDARIL
jgi:hypothetical protein